MAQFVISADTKIVNRQHRTLKGMAGVFDQAAHIQACNGILYAVMHGQTSVMNQHVDIMGHAKGAMNKWACEFGPFKWVGKDKDKPAHLALDDTKLNALRAEHKDMDGFIGWLSTLKTYLELTPPKNDFPGQDLLKVVKREIAKTERYIANPEKYDLTKVNADGLAGLKAWATDLELRRTANLQVN